MPDPARSQLAPDVSKTRTTPPAPHFSCAYRCNTQRELVDEREIAYEVEEVPAAPTATARIRVADGADPKPVAVGGLAGA